MKAMAAQAGLRPRRGESRTRCTTFEKMSAEVCVNYGEQLLDTGRWQAGERLFFAALEKGEQAGDWKSNPRRQFCLGRLCRQRGDLPRAMALLSTSAGSG